MGQKLPGSGWCQAEEESPSCPCGIACGWPDIPAAGQGSRGRQASIGARLFAPTALSARSAPLAVARQPAFLCTPASRPHLRLGHAGSPQPLAAPRFPAGAPAASPAIHTQLVSRGPCTHIPLVHKAGPASALCHHSCGAVPVKHPRSVCCRYCPVTQ